MAREERPERPNALPTVVPCLAGVQPAVDSIQLGLENVQRERKPGQTQGRLINTDLVPSRQRQRYQNLPSLLNLSSPSLDLKKMTMASKKFAENESATAPKLASRSRLPRPSKPTRILRWTLMKINILLWNTESNKQALEVLLEEARYDLLAIQEPWINRQTKSTYCPRNSKYHLVHSLEGRTAIFVSRRFDVGQWSYETANTWCRIWFPDSSADKMHGFELWSVYNPPDNDTLTLDTLLQQPKPALPTVLAGDFNLHHPLWDDFGRYEENSEYLLQLALDWNLDLQTPRGTHTRAPQGNQQGRPSTIDHFWASSGLSTTYYGLETRGKSDHYPQVLEVDLNLATYQQSQHEGWNWKKMDVKRIQAEAAYLPLLAGLDNDDLQNLEANIQTSAGLSQAFDWLVEELTRIAEAAAPRRKTNRGFSSPWWTAKVEEAAKEARRAERQYKQTPTHYCKTQLNQGLRVLANTLAAEKTKAWRTTLQEATKKQDLLWKLERWARCRSFCPAEPPKLPTFAGPPGQSDLSTFPEKAAALAKKFFPNPSANLEDIQDPKITSDWEPRFLIQQPVTYSDIDAALSMTAPWKAPGEDLLPIGFLKTCGKPLYRVLAVLATRCFELGWFPARFKRAKTIVLQKPGKPPTAYRTAAGYRPIAVLPTLGKLIEAIAAERITAAAETNDLLPDEQMGNRKHRSTELAIRLVVAQVQESWKQKAATSLLQLDISGAFDTVNHTRLLATLREYGFPRWLVLWIRAWLADRVAILHFDGQKTQDISVTAGIPQGSPLSPILFILYIASLYRVLMMMMIFLL
jgi:hypothetical protein